METISDQVKCEKVRWSIRVFSFLKNAKQAYNEKPTKSYENSY
jgi:hypothetical protein